MSKCWQRPGGVVNGELKRAVEVKETRSDFFGRRVMFVGE